MSKKYALILSACLAASCSDSGDTTDTSVVTGEGYSVQYLDRLINDSNCSREINYAHVVVTDPATNAVIDPADYNVSVSGNGPCVQRVEKQSLNDREGFYIKVDFDPNDQRFFPATGSTNVANGTCDLSVSVTPTGQAERNIPVGDIRYIVYRGKCS